MVETSEMRVCALVPTYNNPATVAQVVRGVLSQSIPVILIDDGSDTEARAICERLRDEHGVTLIQRANGGKGAAVKDGLLVAKEQGFTHAIQIDADGQHDVALLPLLIDAARRNPEAQVLGEPLFDETAPKSRLWGRRITNFWCAIETGGRLLEDPLFGLRLYPVQAAIDSNTRANRMDWDPEIAVRMTWNGVPIVHVPTKVRYMTKEEGGVSHFRMFRDNVRISLMHSRLCIERLGRVIGVIRP